MIEITPILDKGSMELRIAVFKDNEKLMSFNYDFLHDLTYKSPPSNPFRGPEMSKEEMAVELMTVVKNECPQLAETSVEDLVELFNPLIKDFKIKVWDGKYLPFSKD